MITVVLGSSVRNYTGGDTTLEVEADSVRRLIKLLDERFPGIAAPLTDASSIAIDGEIIPDAIYEDIPDGAEVHFIPTIAGG